MSDEKKLEQEALEPTEQELKARRDFLKSLGRWSAIIIGTTLGGLMPEHAAGWVNGSVGWVNARGGWINGGRAWINGGGGGGASWVNRSGGGGAGWVNRSGGGGAGWVNRRGGGGSWVNHR